MPSSVRSEQAAQVLLAHWHSGQPLMAWPAELQSAGAPVDRVQGYAVQAALARQASPKSVAGWKIAATSEAGQRHIGVSGPLAGRVLAERVHPDGASLSMQANRMAVAEPEFVFRLGVDLPPRATAYAQDEVMAAVDALFLGLEVPNSRWADFVHAGEAKLIADNACAHEFVLGPQVSADWRALDLSQHAVQAQVVGASRRYERAGLGANVLGDPRRALTWLVQELSSLGVPLAAGQFVTTGTCMPPLEIVAGDEVLADFGVLGQVRARFTD